MHYYFNILVILHWWTNNNRCVLSQIDDDIEKVDTGYSQHLIKTFFGISNLDDFTLNMISYSMIIIPWYLTYIKLKKCNTKI